MNFTPEQQKTLEQRKLWRPRHKPCEQQCAGCPFAKNNSARLAKVLRTVAAADPEMMQRVRHSLKKSDKQLAFHAKMQVRMDLAALNSGEFVCHETAYNVDTGELRPVTERRQCIGARDYWLNGEDFNTTVAP